MEISEFGNFHGKLSHVLNLCTGCCTNMQSSTTGCPRAGARILARLHVGNPSYCSVYFGATLYIFLRDDACSRDARFIDRQTDIGRDASLIHDVRSGPDERQRDRVGGRGGLLPCEQRYHLDRECGECASQHETLGPDHPEEHHGNATTS